MFCRITTTLILCFATTAWAGSSVTEQYFDGLRQRGLFDLAEGEALRRLSQPDLTQDHQAALIAELARTFTAHAQFTTGREQADLWDRSTQLISDFINDHPDAPQRLQLELLDAELALSRALTLRWFAELIPEQPQHRSDALDILTSAHRTLVRMEESLRERLRHRIRLRTERTETLTPTELNDLLTSVRLLLGTSELELARLSDDPARKEHLARAETWLSNLAKGATAVDATWQAQVALAEAARLEGKFDVVRRRLSAIDPISLSDAAKDASAAVTAKLLIDEGKPERTVAFLIEYRRTRGSLTGELRLIQLQGLAAAASVLASKGNEKEAQTLRNEIPKVVSWIEAEHGGFWAYRARLAAREVEKHARFGLDVAEHVNRAEASLASGDFETAIAAYNEAGKSSDTPELAAELAYRRASVLLQAERFEDAASAFADIASTWQAFEKAPEAHLLSAYALGRLHDQSPSTARREAYIARLNEHRSNYAGTSTAAEATLRLARLYEQRRQYSQAVQILPDALNDPNCRTRAAAALARNYENLLRYLKDSRNAAATPNEELARSRQIEEWTSKAESELLSAAQPLLGENLSSPFTAGQAEFALRASRILISHAEARSVASRLLDRLATATQGEHPKQETEFWAAVRQSMLPLRIVSLASEQRFTEADQLLDSLKDAPIGDLLAVVRGLAEMTDPTARAGQPVIFGASDGPVGPRLDDLRQVASELLSFRRQELSPAQASQLDLLLAKTSLSTGDADAALARFATALSQRPNDKHLLTEAASTLLTAGDLPAVEQSRDYWRRLEKLESAGSPAWLQARMKVIEANLALGDHAEARKLLTVTKLLHPSLGDASTRAEFNALEQRASSQTAASHGSQAR